MISGGIASGSNISLVSGTVLWKRVHLEQWSSTWAKSPPRGKFYALWGRFCDIRVLGGDFSLHEVDFCMMKHTKVLN